MRAETVWEILKALPGVRVADWSVERSSIGPTLVEFSVSVDERPEIDELVITVKPGSAPACATCGRPGQYTRSKYCAECRS